MMQRIEKGGGTILVVSARGGAGGRRPGVLSGQIYRLWWGEAIVLSRCFGVTNACPNSKEEDEEMAFASELCKR